MTDHARLTGQYRMPAEWYPHLATYLTWPHNRDTWPGKFDAIPPIFARIAAAAAHFEPVRILVNDREHLDEIRAMIGGAIPSGDDALSRVELLAIPSNDSWIRDYGPIFVNQVDGGGTAQVALDWCFNSWGSKYGACDLDDAAPRRLAERYGFDVIEHPMVLEGGSVDVNGEGSLLTTEACLLNSNRNPALSRDEIEQRLKLYLGVSNILWLGEGIAGDDTDGHVDDLARFVDPRTIVTVLEEDPADANYVAVADNLKRLRAMRDERGRPFRIETLPMPVPVYYEGVRLPASYANFYILNGAVLMPEFGCPADEKARTTLARLFPGRQVVTIPSTDLVLGLGAIHCLTQQHPLPPG